jgi:hypothetical protein
VGLGRIIIIQSWVPDCVRKCHGDSIHRPGSQLVPAATANKRRDGMLRRGSARSFTIRRRPQDKRGAHQVRPRRCLRRLIALIVGAASLANGVSSCGASLVVSSIFPLAHAAGKAATSSNHAGNSFSNFHFITRFVHLIERLSGVFGSVVKLFY